MKYYYIRRWTAADCKDDLSELTYTVTLWVVAFCYLTIPSVVRGQDHAVYLVIQKQYFTET